MEGGDIPGAFQPWANIIGGFFLAAFLVYRYIREWKKAPSATGDDPKIRAAVIGMGIGQDTSLAMIADHLRELVELAKESARHGDEDWDITRQNRDWPDQITKAIEKLGDEVRQLDRTIRDRSR